MEAKPYEDKTTEEERERERVRAKTIPGFGF